MPVFNNILAGSSGQGTGYDIDQSVRLERATPSYLLKDFASNGNKKTWTFSTWAKRADISTGFQQGIFSSDTPASPGDISVLDWWDGGQLSWRDWRSGTTNNQLVTSAHYKDPAQWYHIVVRYDTTDSTAGDRVKLYVNGERVTDFSTENYPSLNYEGGINFGGVAGRYHGVGRSTGFGDNSSQYLAETHFIDGYALDASSFGETNSATNQWVPIEYVGSYGTNGLYLPFSSTELANSFSDSSTDCGDGSPCYAGDTKLLLHFDGADDGTSFPDSSREGHSITRTGTVTKTGQKKFGTASAYFDGNDGLTTSDTSDFTFGTDPFTIECWVYVTSGAAFNTPSASDAGFLFCGDSSATSTRSVEFTIYRGELRAGLYNSDSSSATYISGGTINDETWYHVALSRTASDAWAIYVDGSRVATSSTTKTLPQNANSGQIAIGARIEGGSLGQYFDGYIDDYRITKGVGRYSGASFTAPTAAFTNPTKSITANGDVANTRAQSKIGNSSIYFDGTGDYLSTASSGMGLTGDYTIECWFNTASSTSDNGIISNKYNNSSFNGNFSLRLNDGGNSNDIAFRPYNGTVAEGGLVTSGTGAWSDNTWTHVAVVRSGSGTGNVKMYINGSLAGTSSGASSSTILGNAGDLNIGRQESASAGTNYLDGYMDEIRISSSARYTGTFTPSTTAFTADANTLLLIHSDWTGGLGADNSGNKNDFSPVNLVATDQVLDSPTLNYCTLNPVDGFNSMTATEGNLRANTNSGTDPKINATFQIPQSGKWYWEFVDQHGLSIMVGVIDQTNSGNIYGTNNSVIYSSGLGTKYNFSSVASYGASWTTGDIIGVAINRDDNEITFYKNNSSQGTFTIGGTAAQRARLIPVIGTGTTGTGGGTFNFGQDSSFHGTKTSGSASAQDANNNGDFFYAPPANHLALCSDNLPDPAIADPTAHFNTVLYTGTGSGQSISGVGFEPNFTWIKNRDTAVSHALFDSVRGATKYLTSNSTVAESTESDMLTAFNSDGFSGGGSNQINIASDNYVAWNWKAASSNTSVSAGSIDGTNPTIACTRRTNTTAGFSIVSYTGTGANATVSHGLSVAPDLVIVKNRDSTQEWPIGSDEINSGSWAKYLGLSDTSGESGGASRFNSTAPTSTVVSIGTSDATNKNTENHIMYCFHSVDSYSKVGSYESNNSVDGPMIYLGFFPAFILLKCTNATDNWNIYDNKRNGYNGGTYQLRADSNAAGFSSSATMVDFVSNGFKIRTNDAGTNGSGRTYLYYAVASNPFKTSNAR
jgi:hypothetical protein